MRLRTSVPTLALLATLAAASSAVAQIDLLHAVPTDVAVSSVYQNRAETVGALVDGNTETAWNSRTGNLVGAWIEARIPEGAQVSGVRMTVGFTHRTQRADLFEGNHRVRRVRVSRDGQSLGEHTLDPSSRSPQTIPVTGGGGVYRVEVLEVVAGSRRDWREICVSDFQILGAAPGMSPGGQSPRVAVGALPPPRASGAIDPAALRREARQAVDAFQRNWARYEASQHEDPYSNDEYVPPPPVPQRATRRRLLLRIADVTERVDPQAAGALRVAAALEAPWDAEGFRGTMHVDDLSRIDTAMRATLARVGDQGLSCQYTRARVDVLIARVHEPLELAWRELESMSLDSVGAEDDARLRPAAAARDRLAEINEDRNRRTRIQRIVRGLRFPSRLPQGDWTALQAEIQRELAECR